MFNRLEVCRAAWASESSASQATATRHEIRSDALCSKPKQPYGRREKMKKRIVFSSEILKEGFYCYRFMERPTQNSHSLLILWLFLHHSGADSNELFKKKQNSPALHLLKPWFLASCWNCSILGPSTCLDGDKNSQRHFEQQEEKHLAGRGSSVPGDITKGWFAHTFGKSGASQRRKLGAFIMTGGVHWHLRDAFYCWEMSVKRAVQLNSRTDGGASQNRAVQCLTDTVNYFRHSAFPRNEHIFVLRRQEGRLRSATPPQSVPVQRSEVLNIIQYNIT